MRSYSEDLHARIVGYVKSGHKYREVAEFLEYHQKRSLVIL